MKKAKEPKHLCLICDNAKTFEAEGVKRIYISFGCKYKDTDLHNLVVKLPISDYIVECPRYRRASLWTIVRRRFLWRF